MNRAKAYFLALAGILLGAAPGFAQEQEPTIEELQRRIDLLAEQVDELMAGRSAVQPGDVERRIKMKISVLLENNS